MEKNHTKKKNKKLLLLLLLLLGGGGVAAGVAVPLTMKHNSKSETPLEKAIREYKESHAVSTSTVVYPAPVDQAETDTIIKQLNTQLNLQLTGAPLSVQDQYNAALAAITAKTATEDQQKLVNAIDLISRIDTLTKETDIQEIKDARTVIINHFEVIEKWNAAVSKQDQADVAAQPTQPSKPVDTRLQQAREAFASEVVKHENFAFPKTTTFTAGSPVDVSSFKNELVDYHIEKDGKSVNTIMQSAAFSPLYLTPTEVADAQEWFKTAAAKINFEPQAGKTIMQDFLHNPDALETVVSWLNDVEIFKGHTELHDEDAARWAAKDASVTFQGAVKFIPNSTANWFNTQATEDNVFGVWYKNTTTKVWDPAWGTQPNADWFLADKTLFQGYVLSTFEQFRTLGRLLSYAELNPNATASNQQSLMQTPVQLAATRHWAEIMNKDQTDGQYATIYRYNGADLNSHITWPMAELSGREANPTTHLSGAGMVLSKTTSLSAVAEARTLYFLDEHHAYSSEKELEDAYVAEWMAAHPLQP